MEMARDVHGDLYDELVAYDDPEDHPTCCALAIAAGDDAMYDICDGVDYRVEESVSFETFESC